MWVLCEFYTENPIKVAVTAAKNVECFADGSVEIKNLSEFIDENKYAKKRRSSAKNGQIAIAKKLRNQTPACVPASTSSVDERSTLSKDVVLLDADWNLTFKEQTETVHPRQLQEADQRFNGCLLLMGAAGIPFDDRISGWRGENA
ncbi:UNVERIFIED_CONTAM: hypothetical protein FKN15_062303 [Acipenser sinensis]